MRGHGGLIFAKSPWPCEAISTVYVSIVKPVIYTCLHRIDGVKGIFLPNRLSVLLAYLLLLPILTIAVVTDCRSRKIPNWLTLPAIVAGLVYHTAANGLWGFIFGLEGALLGFALLIIFYVVGGMGAGDVKLMGAVGSLLGPKGVFFVFLYAAITGGFLALALLWWKGCLRGTINRYVTILKTILITRRIFYIPPEEKKDLPVLCYGLVIGLGTFFYIVNDIIVS